MIGHQIRKVPTDYGKVLVKNVDQLPDRNLNPLLNDIILVTTGKLIDLERMKAIWRLNFGYYSDLDLSVYSDKDIWIPSISDYEYVKIENWEFGLENTEFHSNILIESEKPVEVSSILLKFDKFHEYELTINGEFHSLVSQMDFSDSTEIHLLKSNQLKSIKIKAIRGRYKHLVSNFVEIEVSN